MSEIHTGACLCGAVRYSVEGPLRPVVVCHCGQCRRQTGHYLAATSAPLDRFTLQEGAALRWYRASDTAERGFCSACGSVMFWRPVVGSSISFTPGTLDGPTGLAIEGHIFCADKGDYYEVPREGYQRPGWT
jgi:hypothetical protein